MPKPKDEETLLKHSSDKIHTIIAECDLKINGRKFLRETDREEHDDDQKLAEYIGCSVEKCQELQNKISFDPTDIQKSILDFKFNQKPDNYIPLQSTEIMSQINDKHYKVKTNSYYPIKPSENDGTAVGNVTLLSVVVLKSKRMKIDQEFLVLLDQSLCDLRDVITCPNDDIFLQDHSENPGEVKGIQSKDVCKSGYFFINDIFFNDMRFPNNIDYSENVFKWIQENGKNGRNEPYCYYTKALMELSKFSDLQIRLGYPYVYCHQGNCEHLLVFNDIRLMNGHDVSDLTQYPCLVFKAKRNRKVCSICHIYPAKWITRNDMLAYTDPSYQCDRCFDYLHYDENHKKLTQFEAYPYNVSN